MTKKWLLSLALAGSVSLLTACGGATDAGAEHTGAQQSPSAEASNGAAGNGAAGNGTSGDKTPKMPQPDVHDVPAVVATVNGTEIPKKEFTSVYEGQFRQMAMQSQMTGQDVDQDKLKKQTAEGMVGTELLIQETEKRGVEASDKAVSAAMDDLVKASQLKTKKELMATAQKQGMDKSELMSQLKTKVRVDQLIKDESGDTKPTEKELKAAYETAKKQQEAMAAQSGKKKGKIPSFDDARPQLEQQLQQQAKAKATQALVAELRKTADVTINF